MSSDTSSILTKSHVPFTSTCICAIGDYSDAQLLRVNRQALVLHKYYELLVHAITCHRESGAHYTVLSLGFQAGQVLGDEAVAVSTVRAWHAEYVRAEGVFRPDERGHYTRDLLIMEEDVKTKFTKWSLAKAKGDDLSVETAQEYLNTELLIGLEACRIPHVMCSRPRVTIC